jgi:hypothetical protein
VCGLIVGMVECDIVSRLMMRVLVAHDGGAEVDLLRWWSPVASSTSLWQAQWQGAGKGL